MSSVRLGALLNFSSRVAVLGAGLAITVTTSRMGTEQQGKFALFTSIEAILMTLFAGFGVALARRISHHKERPRALVGGIIAACLLLGAMASILIASLAKFGPQAYAPLWILAIGAPWLLVAPNLAGIWLGQGRMGPLAVISVAPPLLVLLAIVGTTALGGGLSIEAVLWSWVIAKTLVTAGVLFAANRSDWIAAPDIDTLHRELPFVAAIGLANFVGMLNLRVDLFLVQHFLGTSATGVYSIAVVVAELLWFVSSSVSQAAFAHIGARDPAASAALVVRVLQWSFLALVLAVPLLWAGAELVLSVFLGPAYAASMPVFAALLPGVLIFGAGSTLSAYFTNQHGRPMIPAVLAGLSLLVNVAVSCALIPRLGMIGGAFATSVSYVVAMVAAFWMFGRLSGTSMKEFLVVDREVPRRAFQRWARACAAASRRR